jgi:hypothetical protein
LTGRLERLDCATDPVIDYLSIALGILSVPI